MKKYFSKIKGYYAAVFEVQNFLWNNVCESAKELGYDITFRKGDSELPAVHITFYDAIKLCNALNEICGMKPVYYADGKPVRCGRNDEIELVGKGIRLPFESEWEYAAAGDKTTAYFWGDEKGDNTTNKYAWMYGINDENAFLIRKPGLKLANEFGLYDVSGNVYEWCFDQYTEYRIMKGGSVALDSVLETKFTSFAPPGIEAIDVGVRLFCDFDVDMPECLFEKVTKDTEYVNHRYDFFELLDRNDKGISEVIRLYDEGEYIRAKKEYVKILKKRAENVSFNYSFNLPIMMGYIDKIMSRECKDNWFDGKNHTDYSWGGVSYVTPLAEKYRLTHDKKYLDKFIYLTNATENMKNEYDNLEPEMLNRVSGSVPDSWYYGQGFDTGGRVGRTCTITLSMLLKFVDDSDITDEFAEAVIKHAVRAVTEDLPFAIKDSRSVVPNQSIDNAKILIFAGNILYGFKASKQVEKLGYERFIAAVVERCALPDGTDMEQSYNYNFAACNCMLSIINYFGKVPEELKSVEKAIKYRVRFLKSVSYPYGGQPASGTSSGTYPPKLYDDIKKLENYSNVHCSRQFDKMISIDNEKLDVTSICFPYSGTTVMKNTSKADAVYLWHFAARPGNGHAVENVNSIQLSAYGMPMIVTAGASTYSNRSFVPEDQWNMIEDFEKYQHSTNGASTVLIDGKGQGRLRYGENNTVKKYDDCCGYGFYSDEFFDYSCGKYSGIYYDNNGELNGEHIREVVYVKKHGVFIVTDTVKAEGEHEFTAKYGIMPDGAQTRENTVEEELYLACGYGGNEVKIDGNHVYTVKKAAPNFELYAPQNMAKIKSQYGEFNPCRGWFRGAIRSRAVEKHDVNITWSGKDVSKNVTVIGVSPNENMPIKNIVEKNGVVVINTDIGCITVYNDRIEAKKTFRYSDVKTPTKFEWVMRNGKMVPDYGFLK